MGINNLVVSTCEKSVVIGIKKTLCFVVVDKSQLLKNIVRLCEGNKAFMMEDLEGSTIEMSVVDSDIRLAVNNSFIYFERGKLMSIIEQL